jgi:hypothetical protein
MQNRRLGFTIAHQNLPLDSGDHLLLEEIRMRRRPPVYRLNLPLDSGDHLRLRLFHRHLNALDSSFRRSLRRQLNHAPR